MLLPGQHAARVRRQAAAPGPKPQAYPLYTQNNKYISVPRFYGIEKFGLPSKL